MKYIMCNQKDETEIKASENEGRQQAQKKKKRQRKGSLSSKKAKMIREKKYEKERQEAKA